MLKPPMIRCSTSLWSADLSALGTEMKRTDSFSDRWHLDVADGHYVPNLLFFPDLVAQLRKHSRLPFEIHLMVKDPAAWIDPFIEAGANIIIICHDSVPKPAEVLKKIRATGKQAGVSLLVDEPVSLLEPLWPLLDIVTIVGTAMGIKGAGMDPRVPAKIREAKQIIQDRKLRCAVQADGGIRRETVPLMAAAGVDYIVPGSLMFREDPASMRRWLATLQP